MKSILIKNGIIITLGETNMVLYNHTLAIKGTSIEKIAPQSNFNEADYTTIIDAKGKVILPGFINAHMHFYSTLVRGLGKAAPSKDFQEVLENLWWRLDKKLSMEDNYISALIPMIDAIKKGTTTLIDHHASPYAITGSLPKIAEAVKKAGLRASLCYELSDRDGDKIAQEGIDENVNFIKECQANPNEQLKALFGMHASFTISDKTMEKAAKLGNDLKTGFHIHTAEAVSDQQYNEKNFGLRVVERLHKFNILGPQTIAAHCVHVNEKEMDLLAKTNTIVVHNPQSNMNNAVGIADIITMQQKGILVGLGTDAMTVNMPAEMRVALWAQHLRSNNPSAGFMEALTPLAYNNAKIANRYWNCGLGELKAGYAADVVLIDYYTPTQLDENTVLGHLCFGIAESPVDTTIANGEILMQGKKLMLNIDEEEVATKARELSAKLWDRF